VERCEQRTVSKIPEGAFVLQDGKRRPFHNPVTGDALTLGEEFSWVMQGIIRRWAFLGLITVVTIVVWTLGNAGSLTWWNLGASYLALLIEGTVGIAMFSQTRRDALILREIRTGLKHMTEATAQRDEADGKRDLILGRLQALADHHGITFSEEAS